MIRKKHGFLKELEESPRAKTIGILGVQSGVGVTTMAVSLAGYLSGLLREKTAIVEYGQKTTFAKMLNTEGQGHFTLKHIDYYTKKSESLSALEYKNYDTVVVDFGSSVSHMGDFIRCTHKIILGTLEPWNVDRYEEFCNHIAEYAGSDTWLHILHGDEGQIRRIMRAYKVCAIKRPYIENVHIVDRNLIHFFQTLF